MQIIKNLLEDVRIPPLYKVRYNLQKEEINAVAGCVMSALQREGTLDRIKPGISVALTAGSREISHIDMILGTIIKALKDRGAEPFIVPAMGSHGGATAEGQKSLLADLGIDEAGMGVPIRASMDTVKISETSGGIPVYVDRHALAADCIIPVGRIKPHTDFKGAFESGLMKMLAIGLGKQQGASICHKLGMTGMSRNIQAIGGKIIEKCNIPFGVGIIENAFHGTYKIVAIPAEKIEAEEPALLNEAKSLIPALPFEKVDVIVCEEMGKDISGTGMDSNIIGRSASLGISRPFAERIGVFALTGKSHGNANGMGLADAVTKRFYDSVIFDQTYPNAVTSAETTAVKLPAVMETDELCVKFLIKTCTGCAGDGLRMVWIKNTLSLNEFYVSQSLYKTALETGTLETVLGVYTPRFNGTGAFMGMGGC